MKIVLLEKYTKGRHPVEVLKIKNVILEGENGTGLERGIKQTLRNVLVQQTGGEVLTKFSVQCGLVGLNVGLVGWLFCQWY